MSTPSLFQDDPRIELNITLEWSKRRITFDWLVRHTDKKLAHGAVWAADSVLQWRITGDGEPENFECLIEPLPIEVAVRNVAGRFPVAKRDVKVFGRRFSAIMNQWEKKQIDKVRDPWEFVAIEVLRMGEELASSESWLAPAYDDFDLAPDTLNFLERKARREEKKRLEWEAIQKRVAESSRRNEKRKLDIRRHASKDRPPPSIASDTKTVSPMPQVRMEIAAAPMPAHNLFRSHSGIDSFLKIECASLMWISNQSDDLLCLPFCSIDHLEYQVRTALRVTGASKCARRWMTNAPMERSWERKTGVLPSLTRTAGAVTIFTQFFATQKALAESLAKNGVKTWILNGETPAAQRQGRVESFREEGGGTTSDSERNRGPQPPVLSSVGELRFTMEPHGN